MKKCSEVYNVNSRLKEALYLFYYFKKREKHKSSLGGY